MKGKKPVDMSASVRRRLLNRAKAKGEDYNFTLSQFAIERFLYRLGVSVHKQRFVLKGASLFCLWSQEPHRATWDLDLLGRGGGTVAEIEAAVRDICATPVDDDGVRFDPSSAAGEPIREDQEYQGVRVRLVAHLGQARVPLQVDVGFGDAVTPAPQLAAYPTALEQPQPHVLVYSREAVIAEKLEALVALGPRNSRMKDFYDLHSLALRFDFDGSILASRGSGCDLRPAEYADSRGRALRAQRRVRGLAGTSGPMARIPQAGPPAGRIHTARAVEGAPRVSRSCPRCRSLPCCFRRDLASWRAVAIAANIADDLSGRPALERIWMRECASTMT